MPVKAEAQFIGFSIMSCLEQIHEFVYLIDPPFEDGTWELLHHIKDKYAHEKLKIIEDTRPGSHDMTNPAFNRGCYDVCIEHATGDAIWALHPDMIVTNPEAILHVPQGPLSWWSKCTSFAGNLETEITVGRATKWQSMFARKFGLHYWGGYGDTTENFYFKDITGNAHTHHGQHFDKYPFRVEDSGIAINHYCEMKPYARRLEKMICCLQTQYPGMPRDVAEHHASYHPRVTLISADTKFGKFVFEPTKNPVPAVFAKYKDEFNKMIKEPLCV
jgi:hypothetical protein